MLTRLAGPPTRDSPFTSTPQSSYLEPLTQLTLPSRGDSSEKLRHIHTMARIRRGLQRGESPEPTQYRFYPNPAAYPAAFSSRLLDDSAPLAGHGKHRLMQLMEARKKCDAVDSTRYTEQARLMWAGKEFPEHVDDEQRKWYLCVQDCRQVRDAATELKTYASIEEADAMEEVADAPVTVSRVEVQALHVTLPPYLRRHECILARLTDSRSISPHCTPPFAGQSSKRSRASSHQDITMTLIFQSKRYYKYRPAPCSESDRRMLMLGTTCLSTP
jgi:hypothetical protein